MEYEQKYLEGEPSKLSLQTHVRTEERYSRPTVDVTALLSGARTKEQKIDRDLADLDDLINEMTEDGDGGPGANRN